MEILNYQIFPHKEILQNAYFIDEKFTEKNIIFPISFPNKCVSIKCLNEFMINIPFEVIEQNCASIKVKLAYEIPSRIIHFLISGF